MRETPFIGGPRDERAEFFTKVIVSHYLPYGVCPDIDEGVGSDRDGREREFIVVVLTIKGEGSLTEFGAKWVQ